MYWRLLKGKKPAKGDVLSVVWLCTCCPVTCCDHTQIALRLGWLNGLKPPIMGDYGPKTDKNSWIGRISSAASKFLHIAMLQWCDVMSHSMLCFLCCFRMQHPKLTGSQFHGWRAPRDSHPRIPNIYFYPAIAIVISRDQSAPRQDQIQLPGSQNCMWALKQWHANVLKSSQIYLSKSRNPS